MFPVVYWIVYAVIGVVFGWLVTWVAECDNRAIVVVAGLVGGLVAGGAYLLLGGNTGLSMTYAGFFVAMMGASVLAWLPTKRHLWRDAMELSESLGHKAPSAGA